MSFNSLVFLVYLVIVLFLYYILPHKVRWIMLLIASYVFYAYWDFSLIFLIVTVTLTAYGAGLLLEITQKKALRQLILWVTIVVCLGILIFFKYFNFFSGSVTSIARLFGATVDDFFLDLVLPVGISFYTFQTLSYVIDVYRDTIKAEKHLGYFALFVSFFPQLVAGPIERPSNLIPQLKANHKLDKDNLIQGFKMLTAGFVKKVVIADTLSVYVNAVYNAPELQSVTGLAVVLGTILFLFQIYCDFSGYSDIATGCAKMMGIELMVNFNRPLQADSLEQIWARWHISLNTWFRDYIYVPLNYRAMGKSHMRARVRINLFIVFMVSGLWHGASWTYVLWGVYNGICILLEDVLKKPISKLYAKKGWKKNNPKTRWLRIIRTDAIMLLGLLLFRSTTVANAFMFIGKIFSDWGFTAEYFTSTVDIMGIDIAGALSSLMLIFLVFALDKFIMEPRGKDILADEKSLCVNCNYVYLIWLIAIAWLLLIASGQTAGFIYFQF